MMDIIKKLEPKNNLDEKRKIFSSQSLIAIMVPLLGSSEKLMVKSKREVNNK